MLKAYAQLDLQHGYASMKRKNTLPMPLDGSYPTNLGTGNNRSLPPIMRTSRTIRWTECERRMGRKQISQYNQTLRQAQRSLFFAIQDATNYKLPQKLPMSLNDSMHAIRHNTKADLEINYNPHQQQQHCKLAPAFSTNTNRPRHTPMCE
jgi:hypothetical protein